MIERIKQMFCKHGDLKLVEDMTWINLLLAERAVRETRKYLVCTKCGYKKKISNK